MSAPDQTTGNALPQAPRRRGWYDLERRHSALLWGRLGAYAALAVVAASGLIDEMSPTDREAAAAMCAAAAALQLLLWLAPVKWPKLLLLAAADLALVVDAGLILGLALVSGGRESLALWLLPLMALAATVALSVRTGVKAALLSAIVVGAVQAIDQEGAASATAGPLIMTVAVVVVAGALTQVNERRWAEGNDLLAIVHDASVKFVTTDDPRALARIGRDAAQRLLPGWTVAVDLGSAPAPPGLTRADAVRWYCVHLTAPEREGDARLLGAISGWRTGHSRLRGDVRNAVQTLGLALSEALSRAELVGRLAALSMADPLTGLGNRRAFDGALANELSRLRRNGTPVGLVLLDVDRFKLFNDRHGHQAGDEALVGVAEVLRAEARAEDHPCRVGGEEFAVLLAGADDRGAMLVAERIRRAVEGVPAAEPVTVSLGVAEAEAGDDADTLYARADARLYAAKEGGRNRVVGVSPAR